MDTERLIDLPVLQLRREPLTREKVLLTALAIVDREGLSRLSMRRLGAELGVDPMAIYYYVPNKAALLDGIVDAVVSRTGPIPERSPGEDVVDWIVHVFTQFWLTMGRHPNALPLMDTRPISGEAAMAAGEQILIEMERAGVALDVAVQGLMLLTTVTIALAQTREARSKMMGDPEKVAEYVQHFNNTDSDDFPRMRAGFLEGQTKDWNATLGFTIRSVMRSILDGQRPDAETPAIRC